MLFLFQQQPIRYIINLYAFMTVFRMFRSGNNEFRVSIPYLKKRRYFPVKGFLTGNVITHLNIYFFTASLCYEVNFFLIELSYINMPCGIDAGISPS